MMMRYLAAHWVLPVHQDPFAHGFLAVRGNVIAQMGRICDLPAPLAARLSRRLTMRVAQGEILSLTPGLMNVHTHLELSEGPAMALAPHGSMADWLMGVMERKRQSAGSEDPQALTQRCRHGAMLSLRAGVSCVNDVSSTGESLDALASTGLRGLVAMEFFYPWAQFHPHALDPLIARYHACFRERATTRAAPGRLRCGLSPHSPYNVSPAAWRAMADACRPALIHSHVAESRDEWRWVRGQPNGMDRLHQAALGRTFAPSPLGGPMALSPIAYLESHGLLDDATLLAHGVFSTRDDRRRLARYGVALAHCPRSNLALSGRTLHWPSWRSLASQGGLTVALGSDSLLSSPDLDVRAEGRIARATHRWSADETLWRVTRQGACAMGWQGTGLGELRVGAPADVTLWRSPKTLEGLSPAERWLAEPTCAQSVWVDGCRVWDAEGRRM